MAIVNETTTKCPYCGGLLKSFSYGVKKCSCCNAIFNIEFKNPDLLEKANNLRKNNYFEEALGIYKEILSDNPNFPEANWGALLSEYGIEYVLDNHKEIPTIHRPVQNYKINENRYATCLLENTFGDDHDYYLFKINQLEDLRLKIEQNIKNLQTYDVFISCKITSPLADGKEKTPEYKWADEIYKKLKERGLDVFFSPYSLPATNGAYEPIIYSALQSAKYLIVLASDIDNLNSKWIKNEWGRFLEIKKQAPSQEKFYKLVINDSVAKDVPSQLKDVSFIEHDNNGSWLTSLESAVVSAFPDIKNKQGPIIVPIDISLIDKKENELLTPIEIIHKGNSIPIVYKNPYTIHYKQLEEDYTIDDNVQTCIHMVEIQLRNGHFTDAQYELNRYLNFIGNSEDLDYNILLLQLLINYKAKSLEDFIENKLQVLDDFEIFEKIIKKLPKSEDQKMILPLCDYIMDSIKQTIRPNAFNIYKIISNIDTPTIKKLNYSVVQSLLYLSSNPKLLIDYAHIATAYVASYDIEDYINLSAELAKKLCELGLFDETMDIIKDLRVADPQNSTAMLLELRVKNKAKNLNELFSHIEKSNMFVEIEDLLPRLYMTGVIHVTNLLKERIVSLMDEKKYSMAASWLDIVSKTDFDNRMEYFKQIMDKCKNFPQSDEVFYIAMNSIDQDNKEYFMETTLHFISVLIRNKQFDVAKKYCKILYKYDNNNMQVLNLHLCAELQTDNYSYDNINLLQDMTIIEKMLIIQDTFYAKQALLTQLINNCIKYLNSHDVKKDDDIFEVFYKLLSYCTSLERDHAMKNKINTFAYACVSKGLFSKAEWYFKMLIRLDKTYHQAYWGIIMTKLKCTCDDDLEKCPVKINSLPEYTLAMMYAKNDIEAENKYGNILSKQLHYKKKAKKPKIIFISIAAVVAVACVVLLIVL